MTAEENLYHQYHNHLSKDCHFQKLLLPQQEQIIKKCVEEGSRCAKELYDGASAPSKEELQEILNQQGIHVVYKDTKYDLPYIAEYIHRKNQIDLYTRRIKQMQEILSVNHPEYFLQYDLFDMCLSHELFHHLETVKNGVTGKIAGIPVKLLGLIPTTHWLPEGSEIAAHVFVKELLALDFSTYTFAEEMAEYIAKEREDSSK